MLDPNVTKDCTIDLSSTFSGLNNLSRKFKIHWCTISGYKRIPLVIHIYHWY